VSSPLARHWTLDPEVEFLNHGSFGACPRSVLDYQRELRAEIERQPVEFFVRRYNDRLDAARETLARFLSVDARDLVAVPNTTTGVNTVLRSLPFGAGDELLVTDHEYNACRNAIDFVAARAGARVVVAAIPFPLRSPREVVDAVSAAATPRTRLALIDHITSQTGLVLPVREIVSVLAARGIETLVDGAHAPGMVPLEVEQLGAAYYTGNGHKWLCAPKGAAFLWVRRDRQQTVRPLVISHGANSPRPGRSRFHDEFDWTGTSDPTAFLCLPRAIECLGAMVEGGWSEVRRRNRALALEARSTLAAALDVEPPCPATMVGSLVSLPLPDGSGNPPPSPLYGDPLQEALLARHRIEAPVIAWPQPPRRLLRVSAQLYNDASQYRRLAEALRLLLGSR